MFKWVAARMRSYGEWPNNDAHHKHIECNVNVSISLHIINLGKRWCVCVSVLCVVIKMLKFKSKIINRGNVCKLIITPTYLCALVWHFILFHIGCKYGVCNEDYTVYMWVRWLCRAMSKLRANGRQTRILYELGWWAAV